MAKEHGAVSKRHVEFKVFLDGVEIPAEQVTITRPLGTSVCEVAIEPDERIDRFRARTQVWVFVRDPYFQIQDTNRDPLDRVLDEFMLEWRGEYVRHTMQESGESRHAILHCVDDQNFVEKQPLGITELANGLGAPFYNGSAFWLPEAGTGSANLVMQALATKFMFPEEQAAPESVQDVARSRDMTWEPLVETEDNFGFRCLLFLEYLGRFAAPLRLHFIRSELLQRYRSGPDATMKRFFTVAMARDLFKGAQSNFNVNGSVMEVFDWILRKGYYSRINIGAPPTGKAIDASRINQATAEVEAALSETEGALAQSQALLAAARETLVSLEGKAGGSGAFSGGVELSIADIRASWETAQASAETDIQEQRAQQQDQSSLLAGLSTEVGDIYSTVQDFGLIPNLYYAFPPICNWIFPQHLESWTSDRDHLQQMTRLAVLDSNMAALQGVRYLAPAALFQKLENLSEYLKEGDEQTRVANANHPAGGEVASLRYKGYNLLDSMTVEELEKGILYRFEQSDFDYFSGVSQLLQPPANLEALTPEDIEATYKDSHLIGALADNPKNSEYFRFMQHLAEFRLTMSQLSRSVSIQGPYNRWAVVGMPMVVARRENSVIGLLVNKVDVFNVSGEASTAYNIQYARTFSPSGGERTEAGVPGRKKLEELRRENASAAANTLIGEDPKDFDTDEAKELRQVAEGFEEAKLVVQRAKDILETSGVLWDRFLEEARTPNEIFKIYDDMRSGFIKEGEPAFLDLISFPRGRTSKVRAQQVGVRQAERELVGGAENNDRFFPTEGFFLGAPAGASLPANTKFLWVIDVDVFADYAKALEALEQQLYNNPRARSVLESRAQEDPLFNTKLGILREVLSRAKQLLTYVIAGDFGSGSGPTLLSGAFTEDEAAKELRSAANQIKIGKAAVKAEVRQVLTNSEQADSMVVLSAAGFPRTIARAPVSTAPVFEVIRFAVSGDSPSLAHFESEAPLSLADAVAKKVEDFIVHGDGELPLSFEISITGLSQNILLQEGDPIYAIISSEEILSPFRQARKRTQEEARNEGVGSIYLQTPTPEIIDLISHLPDLKGDKIAAAFSVNLAAGISRLNRRARGAATFAKVSGYRREINTAFGKSVLLRDLYEAVLTAYSDFLVLFAGLLRGAFVQGLTLLTTASDLASEITQLNSDLVDIDSASDTDANVALEFGEGMTPVLPFGDLRYLDTQEMDEAYAHLIGAQEKVNYLGLAGDANIRSSSGGLAFVVQAQSGNERQAKLFTLFKKFSAVARKLFPFGGSDEAETYFYKWSQSDDPVREVDLALRRKSGVSIKKFMASFPAARLEVDLVSGRDEETFIVLRSASTAITEAAFSKLRAGRFASPEDKEVLNEVFEHAQADGRAKKAKFLTEGERQRIVIEYSQRHVGSRPVSGR